MKKQDLIFNVKGFIYDPATPAGMCSDLYFNITATFSYLDDSDNFAYGNKTYMCLSGNFATNPHYKELFDCRYDRTLKAGRETEYITAFFNNRYTGKNGSYAVKSLTIEKC